MKTHHLIKLAALAVGITLSGSVFPEESTTSVSCELPSPPSTSAPQADFDAYSWQIFAALNWPVSSTERGEPDCSKPLGSGTPSWQTYKTSNQIFLANAEDPGPWNEGYDGDVDFAPLLQVSKASNADNISAHKQAVGGWLIDQNGNPTYFQMWANETWYDYVVSNQFYNKDNFSNSTRIALPNNAIELKSAWRILTEQDQVSRYITQDSTVALFNSEGEPTGQFEEVTLGLVGFHAIVKAPGYPQWIWATFEHVDNVPDSKTVEQSGPNGPYWTTEPDPVPGVTYSYFDATATNPNQSPCQAGDPDDCISFNEPNPLTRITPIRDDAVAQNAAYHQDSQVKDTVLVNYELITTQWPTMPDNPGATHGNPTPTVSANTTMESYIQSSSNCMNCHGTAALPNTSGVKSDYSFLFSEAHSPSSN